MGLLGHWEKEWPNVKHLAHWRGAGFGGCDGSQG
ncbi:hypothetical protein TcasGA2_TC032961 [Tribolium castaneum]|uniref:Uncharacterized protein n=1 Tax=Tribolium castaneum TaxID=7070 RepID=A0A139W8D6_TRICA|nr:hypothetical protein TcasGA2_TC032961 [Tribolium castaneum]